MAGGAQHEADPASGEPPRKQMICHRKGDEEVRRGSCYALAQPWGLWGLWHGSAVQVMLAGNRGFATY
jgi:hypothetical protein